MSLKDLMYVANMIGLDVESVEDGIVIDNILIKVCKGGVALFNNITYDFLEYVMSDEPLVVCGRVFYMLCKFSEEINI